MTHYRVLYPNRERTRHADPSAQGCSTGNKMAHAMSSTVMMEQHIHLRELRWYRRAATSATFPRCT